MKKISTLVGIIIIVALAILVFGGVFTYQYFMVKPQQAIELQVQKPKVQNTEQNQNLNQQVDSQPVITYTTDQDAEHNSEHVYPKDVEIKGGTYVFQIIISWPQIKNISDKNILDNINKVLNFKDIIGFDDDFSTSDLHGLTGVDYVINYDKNDILNITFFSAYMGAYPSESVENYSINLTTGESIKFSDVFYQNKINDLSNVLNAKLQDNIKQRETSSSNQSDGCFGVNINEDIKEFDPNNGKFAQEDMVGFKITATGMEFTHNFGFPHVVQACQPNGKIILSYDQLKDYIDPNGLLGSEVK